MRRAEILQAARQVFLAALSLTLVLSACGGGGGGEDASPGTPTFRVGGLLAGLGPGKTVVIADASGPSAAVSANGSYSLQLPAGTAYSLRIAAQPAGQTCTLTNGSGTATADVNNVSVTCGDNEVPPNARTVAGSVSGLSAGKVLVLQLAAANLVQEARVTADGAFSFTEPVAGAYSVTVRSQPVNQVCTVAGGQGVADGNAPTPTISVTCAATAYRLSGAGNKIGLVCSDCTEHVGAGDSRADPMTRDGARKVLVAQAEPQIAAEVRIGADNSRFDQHLTHRAYSGCDNRKLDPM